MEEEIQLFEKKKKIYPRRVWGKYRKLKWVAMVALLGIYYLTPWLRWDRGPGVPDQAILIDIHNSRAYFFFIEIWPQEVYFITGILIMAAVGLFFVTSLFGRVWCGYACPQTVWTDLFVWVERIVQGDRNARQRLDQQKWNFEKIRKKLLTHIIWLIIGACTGGAWVFYFNDAPTLFDQIIHLSVPFKVWIWILCLTLSTYVMAGFAREQVCKYMCPYARFQSAMFDKDTLIITYDEKRGEPRHKGAAKAEGKGDCIDCGFCEVVCPQGIDIRDGLQMDCIACGLCIDACNNVMDKLKLPQGLIRYDTQNHMENKIKFRLLRPRTIYYAAILSFVGALMIYGLATRTTLELHVLHDRNPLFVQLADGTIRNSYTVKILNKTHSDKVFDLKVTGLPKFNLHTQPEKIEVIADSIGQFRVFLSAEDTRPRQDINFMVTDTSTGNKVVTQTVFIGAE